MVKLATIVALFPVYCGAMHLDFVGEIDHAHDVLQEHVVRMQTTIAVGEPRLEKINVAQVRQVLTLCRRCSVLVPNIHQYVETHNLDQQEQFAQALPSLIAILKEVTEVLSADGRMKVVHTVAPICHCAERALVTLQQYIAHEHNPTVPAPVIPQRHPHALIFQ